uniref:NADH-ubiquinone oxidoreductase chain 1 n=1 Tax=Stylochus stellae TaxID=3319417 RepID=A0A2R3SK66_9PLAT|nr:NADH dehydrogenase subunit 1 [Imogine stellae]
MLVPWLFVFVNVLLSIPFLTLLERKVLSYIQSRKGPNKVSYMGLLQPIGDGAKLVLKELGTPNMANMILFWASPVISFFLMILAWAVFPSPFLYFSFNLGVVFFLCIASLQVYTLLGSGWGSNSKYALLGSVRGAAQTISYEVSLIFIILFPCSLEFSYNFATFIDKSYSYILILSPIFLIWFISCLAETNRAPFDFAEGESELVSGFNVEFSAFSFACLFLSEYGNILLMSFLTAIFFFPSSYLSFILFGSFFSFCFVWARGCLPRFRYDFLMAMAWKIFLPVCLLAFFVILI